MEDRAGPPRGQAPPYGSPPHPAREALTPPCSSSEALALRGRPAPHPSWPHLPPQAPRGAPGTLQGERLRSQGGSCGPQPLKGRTHLGAQTVPGHGRKPQDLAGNHRSRGAAGPGAPASPQLHPWAHTVTVYGHADFRARAEKHHVLWTEAAFCDGASILQSPVGTAEGWPGPCALQGRRKPPWGLWGRSRRERQVHT